ncbi:DJ-1/PfpI family protein [Oleiagrimonas sp. MCCC 1A03011]|uniref:GlxA family transcriptional regulator n=1 Tax=Oleiagrimonas sp. MCCC 1A03011 TaxID=1926883 RepID=UPI000DC3543D|nr:DJ-1/PfpI family protein [Oleiagrimonas sp. MCCC 1A03011]RAP56238.1 AraC family transcriptional regulator [Oleiagrimonas sp. MCCC 1A03011]
MKKIGFLVYPDMKPLDLTGPLDVFGMANRSTTGEPPYRLHVIGLNADSVRAENNLVVTPTCTLDDAPLLDTLLIPGGIGSRRFDSDTRLLAWLRHRAPTTRRVVSVCTGLYILAATGLLDGRRATTHWRYADDVARRYPALDLQPDRLFLRDGRFATSGGLTAGMDLALALIEEDLGAALALDAARDLVMYVKRPGNQAQFSAPLAAQTRGSGRMTGLLEWLLDHLAEPLTVERMAACVAMSPRNFRRVFTATFDTTPARFVERLRLEQACLQLTSQRDSVVRIARAVGFNSVDTFRRVFRNRYDATPDEYRQRFAP